MTALNIQFSMSTLLTLRLPEVQSGMYDGLAVVGRVKSDSLEPSDDYIYRVSHLS
jgi:hypothetical protein